MFKRIARLGTVPTKYQFAIVLNSLQLGVDFSGSVGAIWTRGPHKVKSIIVEGENGSFYWDKDQQTQQPMMLVCTLYLEKDKDKKKDKKDASTDGPIFNSKTSRITLKQVQGTSTKTIGEITIDLANYANAKGGQWDLSLPLEKSTDKKAQLSFTIHSRPSTVNGGAADFDTMSTMEGMDQSYIDTDSIADFSGFSEVQRESMSASQRIKTVHQSNPRPPSKSVSKNESSEEDLPEPDDILNQFKKGRSTPPPQERSTSVAPRQDEEDRKKSMRYESSDDDDDDDGELENPANMFAKKPTPAETSVVKKSTDETPKLNVNAPKPPTSTPSSKPIPPTSSKVTPTNTFSPVKPAHNFSSTSVSSTTSPSNLSERDFDAPMTSSRADDKLTAVNEENSSLKRELALAEDRISKLEQERKSQDGANVHRDCYTHDDMKSAISQGIAPLAAKMKKIEAALKVADARNSELQSDLRRETARSQQFEQELNSHDESTRAMLDDRESRSQARIAELESQVSSLESRLEAERAESRARTESLERVLNDRYERSMSLKESEMKQLMTELEALKHKDFRFEQVVKAKYSKDEEKLRARVAFYEEQVMESEALMNSLRDTYIASNQVLMNEVNTLERKVIDAHSTIADATQESKELSKHIKMLEDQIRKSVDNRSKLSEVVNELTVQLADKSELLGKLMNEKEELTITVERLNKQIQRYNKY